MNLCCYCMVSLEVRIIGFGLRSILVAKTADDFERTYELAFVKPPYMPGFIKKYLAESTAAESELVEKIYDDLANNPLPLESALNNLLIPTLILWGDKDRLTHVSGAAILESLMPNAKAIVMNNIGHMPMMENPELSAKYYLKFRGILNNDLVCRLSKE